MPIDPAPFTPGADEVHAYLAAYPAFTETSRPTVTEVETLIANVASELRAELTVDPPADLVGLARKAVTLGAAADVAASYWPEQQHGETALSAQLYARYQNAINRFRTLLAAETGGPVRVGSSRTPSATLIAARELAAGATFDDPDLSNINFLQPGF